ncbi:unnamed protein product [Paramecium sonneborni]|uniref:Uncharacterized protein n=1 Tax=Paramecium sonneborni TaxID=65129 RepID=A0A8S1Q404_9CILI|nr:unnamed protein product [Paramecium sonneborni]
MICSRFQRQNEKNYTEIYNQILMNKIDCLNSSNMFKTKF